MGKGCREAETITIVRSKFVLNLCWVAATLSLVFSVACVARAQDEDAAEAGEDYKDLWNRGAYREALANLEALIQAADGYVPISQIRNRARLRFATGKVDEAIEDMKYVSSERPEPSHTLELALMYQYRGRTEDYDRTLRYAYGQSSQRRYSRRDRNLVATGRTYELMGKSPKSILTTFYGQIFDQFSDRASFHVGAGDIAYRTSGYDIASKHYKAALDIEPENQDALAGLCECYWKSNDGRLQDMMNVLLSLNPNHPRARAIQVEKLLDLADTEGAMGLIEEALEINPNSLRFLSLKSAAMFLDYDIEGMRELQLDVLDFNPNCSEVYRVTGRVASRQYRFLEGARFQEQALSINPADFKARALYTLDLMRLGREQEGREELQLAFEADPFNVQLYNLLELMDTLNTFETIERGAFVLRLPTHEAPILAEAALDFLDEAIVHFEKKYVVDLEKPILVEMFDNHDDFMVRSVGLPGNAGHLGICFGKLVTMDVPSVRAKGSSNWRSVLWHEFVHVITLQKTKNRMPRWLSEGISVYEEGQFSPAWRSRLDPDFMGILAEEELPGLEDLGTYFTQPRTPGHLMFGYFLGGEFTQFYIDHYGFDALVRTLDLIAQGLAAEEALLRAAKVSKKKLNGMFHEYLESRFEPFENLPARHARHDGEQPHSDEEPASPFTDALKEASEAVKAENWAEAEQLLRRAQQLFPDYTGPDAPLRQLASLYERQGDIVALTECLTELSNYTPTELGACKQLLDTYREQGQWDKMIQITEQALGIDPYDVDLHKAYVEGSVAVRKEQQALDALRVLAYLDRGRATQHRLQRCQILARSEDWGKARREVVELLEELPHYWEAQKLLLFIEDRSPALEIEEAMEAVNES